EIRPPPLPPPVRGPPPTSYVYSFIGPPIAFHAEWPPFMYFASNPASRSAIAVLHPTWNPYAQNTTTGSDFDSSPIQSGMRSGSRQTAPSMMSCWREVYDRRRA